MRYNRNITVKKGKKNVRQIGGSLFTRRRKGIKSNERVLFKRYRNIRKIKKKEDSNSETKEMFEQIKIINLLKSLGYDIKNINDEGKIKLDKDKKNYVNEDKNKKTLNIKKKNDKIEIEIEPFNEYCVKIKKLKGDILAEIDKEKTKEKMKVGDYIIKINNNKFKGKEGKN